MKNGHFRHVTLAICAISFATSVCAQEMNGTGMGALALLDTIESRADRYSQDHPVEKVYIHFDKSFYFIGEDCWYKAYVVRGSDLSPTDISLVLYVDWIAPDGHVIKHQRLKIENGAAAGDIAIDSSFNEGTYGVRAYTNWLRNDDPALYYSRQILIVDPVKPRLPKPSGELVSSQIDLQFFPEGGTFVTGIQTQLAFRGIDVNGSGVDVEGDILDGENNLVATFRSVHNGMGEFPFAPQDSKLYKAVLRTGQSFPLPRPSKAGLTLAASNRNDDEILVRIRASGEYSSSATYLIGHSRGLVCYAAYIGMQGTSKDISISKDRLPEGVLQFTLFDERGIPRCERKLFIRKTQDFQVAISTDKIQYAPRDSIKLEFSVTDKAGNPVQTSLSVSVTDADLLSINSSSENIFTRLLLQSELKGNIENPGWYFETSSVPKAYALDLVMRTHGWSRYNWEKILKPAGHSISVSRENGITLNGRMIDRRGPVSNTLFVLGISGSEHQNTNLYETDSLGHFSIDGIDFAGNRMLSWRVMGGRKGRVQNVEILLDTIPDIPPVNLAELRQNAAIPGLNESFSEVIDRYLETHLSTLHAKVLGEVVVKAARINVKAIGAGSVLVKPGPGDLKSTTSQFIGRYALGINSGKMVLTPEGERWTTPAGAPIVIRIDGYESPIATGPAANPYLELNAISVEEIEFVIVTGDAHNGYSIDIRTKKDGMPPIKQLINVRGYDVVREFYHPKYGSSHDIESGPDNRLTLYWNPHLQTNSDGKATAKFYNTDETEMLHVVAEGISKGHTIFGVRSFGE